jgi:MFS family permease
LGVSYSIGVVFGPLIGGFLSRPYDKIPFLFDNIVFRTFPYLIPNLIISLFAIVGFVLSYFYLLEDKPTTIEDNFVLVDLVEDEKNTIIFKEEEKEQIFEMNPTPKKTNFLTNFLKKIKNSEILNSRTPLLTSLLYALIGLIDIIFGEVFPIWLWTPTKFQGMGFEPYMIGILVAICALFIFFGQVFIAPVMIRNLGMKYTFIFSTLLLIVPNFIFPELYR